MLRVGSSSYQAVSVTSKCYHQEATHINQGLSLYLLRHILGLERSDVFDKLTQTCVALLIFQTYAFAVDQGIRCQIAHNVSHLVRRVLLFRLSMDA